MTRRTEASPEPMADTLTEQLTELRNASIMTRGDEALRFGAMTIAAIRHLESRVAELEATHGQE